MNEPQPHHFFHRSVHPYRDEAEMGEIIRAFESGQPRAGALPSFRSGLDDSRAMKRLENCEALIKFIKDNPHCTRVQIRKALGFKESAVKNNIQAARTLADIKASKKKIKTREDRAGYWVTTYEVIE